jgi:hypothetical protein
MFLVCKSCVNFSMPLFGSRLKGILMQLIEWSEGQKKFIC